MSFLRMEVQEHGLASFTSRIGLISPYNYIICYKLVILGEKEEMLQ